MTVSVREFRSHLSRYLAEVRQGGRALPSPNWFWKRGDDPLLQGHAYLQYR